MISVWDPATLGDELLARLAESRALIEACHTREDAAVRSHADKSAHDRALAGGANPCVADFIDFRESLIPFVDARSIRGFHYTRLTDGEVESIFSLGVFPSTPASLQCRLSRLAADGELSAEDCATIFKSSAFDVSKAREGKFWMMAMPKPKLWRGIRGFFHAWGGEVANVELLGPETQAKLSTIGIPRVLEISAPVKLTRHALGVVDAVIAAYAQSIGLKVALPEFNFYVTTTLPPAAVLKVHTEGDAGFEALSIKGTALELRMR